MAKREKHWAWSWGSGPSLALYLRTWPQAGPPPQPQLLSRECVEVVQAPRGLLTLTLRLVCPQACWWPRGAASSLSCHTLLQWTQRHCSCLGAARVPGSLYLGLLVLRGANDPQGSHFPEKAPKGWPCLLCLSWVWGGASAPLQTLAARSNPAGAAGLGEHPVRGR